MSAAPKCANCGDSGSNPGSEYLDCTRCDVASERAMFEKWNGPFFLSRSILEPEFYDDSKTNFAWAAWQGRAALDKKVKP